jgi:hypothetical protein
VELERGLAIGCVSGFRGEKLAQVAILSIHTDNSAPWTGFVFGTADALKTHTIVLADWNIVLVLSGSRFPQIFGAIVSPDAIPMVDFPDWIATMKNLECKPSSAVTTAVNADYPISEVDRPRDISGLAAGVYVHPPRKNAGPLVKCEQFRDPLNRWQRLYFHLIGSPSAASSGAP